jgi:hypothetical protein
MGTIRKVTQGYCPRCGENEIIYHGSEVEDESIFYEAECGFCDADIREHYNLKFSGMSLFLEQNEVKEMYAGDTILNELNDRKQQEEKA